MLNFRIKSIRIQTGTGRHDADCTVTVTMNSKEFSKAKKNGHLGFLYGTDISNEVYRLTNRLVQAYNPSVDDSQRSFNGIKTITLSYGVAAGGAAALGLAHNVLANGAIVLKYNASIELVKAPKLSQH